MQLNFQNKWQRQFYFGLFVAILIAIGSVVELLGYHDAITGGLIGAGVAVFWFQGTVNKDGILIPASKNPFYWRAMAIKIGFLAALLILFGYLWLRNK